MTNFRIIALDPGGTTGWAVLSAQKVNMPIGEELTNLKFECGYIGPQEHHAELWDLFRAYVLSPWGTRIVTESFEFRNKHRDNVELISREYIGITKLYGKHTGIPVFQQTASEGKVVDRKTPGFVTLDVLKKLGLYKSPLTEWKHSMDAYGHLLYYMQHKGILPRELLVKGWQQ